jgi:hypothetical protein
MKSQTGKARNKRKPWGRVLLVTGLYLLALALPQTSALAEGGKTIATAPTVVYGQQEFGSTAMGQEYPEKGCGLFGIATYRDQFWILSATAGDLLTISWGGVNKTELRLYPVGTTDYTVFSETNNPVAEQELNGNNKNQLQYSVPVSGVMPLEFAVCDYNGEYEKPGPYSFTVTAQHGLAVSMLPRPHIRTNSVIHGSAALVSGAPVPDGTVFTLTVAWPHGSVIYPAASVGGSLAFTLALPEEAEGQSATLSLNRAADSQYLAPQTAEVKTKIARPRIQPPPVRQHHPRRCRRGFHKRRVHGKTRCVRIRHHH